MSGWGCLAFDDSSPLSISDENLGPNSFAKHVLASNVKNPNVQLIGSVGLNDFDFKKIWSTSFLKKVASSRDDVSQLFLEGAGVVVFS